MIINLPQDFIDAMNSTSRKPVQLIEFSLPSETFYLSDKYIGKGAGLANDYQPWIESWGSLRDNTNITTLFEGNSLEIRSGTLTILVSNISKTFVKKLFQVGVENTRVYLYQWFHGMTSPPVLIDIMVCQDPIKHSESTMLLSIDLVSVLMKTNPNLWPEEPGIEAQPIVVGKATGLPLKNLQTARVTDIAQDIEHDYLGHVFIGNGVGFPANGVVSIDSEDMTYDQITASDINITARAQNGTTARPHLRGALMSPYGAVYDYAICSGPVQLVDNLLANGEPYVNSVEFFPGQHPVIARFIGRPPWLKVAPGQDGDDIIPDPVTTTEYGSDTEQHYGNTADEPTNDNAINSASGSATLEISQDTGGGAGTIENRFSTYTDSYNVTPYYSYPDKLYGKEHYSTAKLENVIDDNSDTNTTHDNVQAHVDHKYHHDDSAYGDLTGLTVKVDFNTCDIHKADGRIDIYFVNAGGNETLLDSDELLEYDGDVFGAQFKFSNNIMSYNVKSLVSNFSDLALCRLRVRYTNIRIHPDAISTDQSHCDWDITHWDVEYFTPAGTIPKPYQELVSFFNRDLSNLGTIDNVTAKVYFSASINNANVQLEIVQRDTNDIADDTVLWSSSTSSSLPGTERSFSLGSMSWSEFQHLRIGVAHQITGPDTENITRYSNISFSYVKFELTYQPDAIPTPDEMRVVYAETLVCDVTSNIGENPTPPQVVRHMIEDHSEAGAYIDGADFDAAHTNYDNAGYYLNGVLPSKITLHDALKQVLREGMCRLLFNQGLIKLISYFEDQSLDVDLVAGNDDIQIRSKSVNNQPTSLIKNDITVMYDKDYYLNVYDGKVRVEDSESIANFFRKEYVRELILINSETVAQMYANRLLLLKAHPTSIFTFNMFMKGYQLEKGDRVSVRTFIDERFITTGNILSIDRMFGKGKTGQINLFKVQLSNTISTVFLNLKDTVIIDDTSLTLLKGIILTDTLLTDDSSFEYKKVYHLPNNNLQVVEQVWFELCQVDGYGTCGYGGHGYGD